MNYWEALQKLVDSSELVIDRKKDTPHPQFPEYIYPFDYGHLSDTTSGDGAEADFWIGSLETHEITAIIAVVDLTKRDVEIKILLGCTNDDANTILTCHERGDMRGILVMKDMVTA